MQLRQQQKPINEDRGWQFSVLQAEVFDAVGKPLITSYSAGSIPIPGTDAPGVEHGREPRWEPHGRTIS